MNASSRNILILLIAVVVIMAAAIFLWWRAQGEPEDLIGKISADLAEYEQIIDNCQIATEASEKEDCRGEIENIEEKLAAYEEELLKLQTGQLASVSVPAGTTTATSTR